MRVFLTGVTGFVGRHLLKRLLDEGHSVRAFVRDPEKAGFLRTGQRAGQVEFVSGDIVDGTGLDDGMRSCDAVIHLVGIIAETGKATFERVHHIGTRNMTEAARRNGITRFIHMSALGVRADGVAEYQTSKWKGEEAVRRSGIPFCILRPSLIFGPGSGFVAQMLDLMRKVPFFRPVPGNGKPLFRPIFVGDVTACFTQALTNPVAMGKTIELGGADELPLNDILAEIATCAGIRKHPLHIPLGFMFVGAALGQVLLPHPPVTVGQLRMLKEGSTCDIGSMREVFGITPIGFRAGLRNNTA